MPKVLKAHNGTYASADRPAIVPKTKTKLCIVQTAVIVPWYGLAVNRREAMRRFDKQVMAPTAPTSTRLGMLIRAVTARMRRLKR